MDEGQRGLHGITSFCHQRREERGNNAVQVFHHDAQGTYNSRQMTGEEKVFLVMNSEVGV